MIKDLDIEEVVLDKPELIKIAIVQSTYHSELNENMTEYCKAALIRNKIAERNISVFFTPGTWEVPLVVRKIALSGNYDAIVAFGVIIKGDTYHFEMIANEVARSLMQTATNSVIPIGFEILAVNNLQQAKERASKNKYNKGVEASNAVLHAIKTLRMIES